VTALAPATPHTQSHLLGIVFGITAVTVMGFQDVLVKLLGGQVPVIEILFVRSLVALPLMAIIARWTAGPGALRTKRPLGHALRGLFMTGGYTSFYLAITKLPLADAVALAFSAPLFITALAVPILGEKVGVRRWTAVVVGFIGVLIMVKPGFDTFHPAMLFSLASAISYAGAIMVSRRMGADEPGATIGFYTTLTFLIVSATTMPFMWVTPSWVAVLLIVICGFIAAAGHYYIAESYRAAPASVVAPFDYVAIIWAVLFGWLIWDDLPGPSMIAGIALVIGGGLYVLHREARVAPAPIVRREPRMPT
jgi:drug/metabolite transporter (DMT)-like permease